MHALEYAKQVGERSTEPIHCSCRDHVELFRVHRLHHGAKVDAGIDPLLRELDRRAYAVRLGQRCNPVDDLTAVVAQPAGKFRE